MYNLLYVNYAVVLVTKSCLTSKNIYNYRKKNAGATAQLNGGYNKPGYISQEPKNLKKIKP